MGEEEGAKEGEKALGSPIDGSITDERRRREGERRQDREVPAEKGCGRRAERRGRERKGKTRLVAGTRLAGGLAFSDRGGVFRPCIGLSGRRSRIFGRGWGISCPGYRVFRLGGRRLLEECRVFFHETIWKFPA